MIALSLSVLGSPVSNDSIEACVALLNTLNGVCAELLRNEDLIIIFWWHCHLPHQEGLRLDLRALNSTEAEGRKD